MTAGTTLGVSMENMEKGHSEWEDAFYLERKSQMTDWWATPRFDGIKRPYSVDDVISKSGTLTQNYSSSSMAKKLFRLLKSRSVTGEPVHTSVFSDVMQPQMVERLSAE